jgi:hypothetical protein
MALGNLTYKTPNAINKIAQDLSGSEGCALKLDAQGVVSLAVTQGSLPYGIVVVGSASVDGTYWASTNSTTKAQGVVAQSALEIVDALGCVVQVSASATAAVAAGDYIQVDAATADGRFKPDNTPTSTTFVWGIALTDCAASGQFQLRFAPFIAA